MKLSEVLRNPIERDERITARRHSILGEGITHIEDASVEEVVQTIEDMATMIVSEKLDGANMWFGVDEKGKLYTARGGAKSETGRIRKPSGWFAALGGSNSFAGNGFASAHQALFSKRKEVEAILESGEIVEVEVLFGTTPNAVAYDGKNYMAFLRVVEGPHERIKQLQTALEGKKVVVNSDLNTTTDGIKIAKEKHAVEWNFSSVAFIDSFKLKKINVKQELDKLKAYIRMPADGFPEFNNCEMLTLPVTMVPKARRDAFKKARKKVEKKTLEGFKLPIKEKLLDQFVRKLGPKLGKSAEEGGWIEGVVILDPRTQRLLKIVDKDMFTTVNQFNWETRAAISANVAGSNQLNPSLMGRYFIGLGKIFGIPNLFIPAQTGRILKKLGGKSSKDTLQRLKAELPKGQEVAKYKAPVVRLASKSIKDLDKMLKDYKRDRDKKKLEVQAGTIKKTFVIDEDINERTLSTFAGVRARLVTEIEDLKRAQSLGELLAVMLHNKLRKVHGG